MEIERDSILTQLKEGKIIYPNGSFRVVRKSGLLQYRFMLNGKQTQVYGMSEVECYSKRRDVESGKVQPRRKKETILTYSDWAEKWLTLYKKPKLTDDYYQSIVLYLQKDIYPKIGNTPIAEVTTLKLQTLLQEIPQDCKRTHVAAVLSDSLRRATACRVIPFDPYMGVDFKRYEQPELGALTHAQQLHLIETAKNARKKEDVDGDLKPAYITFLLLTGMRQGEALALTPSDIDVKNNQIAVTKSLTRNCKINPPKTKAGRRIVPFASSLLDIIAPYMGNERVFDFSWNASRLYCSRLFAKAELDFSPHILRHTFITNAYELDFPPDVVRRIVGHARIEQAQPYLALRKASDFQETFIVQYMRQLRAIFKA